MYICIALAVYVHNLVINSHDNQFKQYDTCVWSVAKMISYPFVYCSYIATYICRNVYVYSMNVMREGLHSFVLPLQLRCGCLSATI